MGRSLWSGRITNDTIAPLRALLAGGRTAHKRTPSGPRSTRYAGRRGSLGRFGSLRGPLAGTSTAQVEAAEEAATGKALAAGRAVGSGPSTGVGRWTALPPAESDPTVRAVTNAELLLDRYGVLTRGSVVTEDVPGGFAAVYRVLAAAEEAGKVRRGYFVEGLGASQFASTGAVDRLRSMSRLPGGDEVGGRRVDAADDDEWLAPSPAASGRPGRGGQRGRERTSPPRSSWLPATPPTPTAPPSAGPSGA